MAIDLAAVRADTPGCTEIVHLNNAGASLPTRRTLDAVIAQLEREAHLGGYEAAAAAEPQLTAVRVSAARLLGAAVGEIALTTSDTAGFAKALWGFVLTGGISADQTVVVDRIAYNSHYLALLQAQRLVGFEITVLPSTDDGSIDPAAIEATIAARRVALVSATYIGTHCGLVNPIVDVGAACRRAGVMFFLDACQAIGQLPLDVAALGCDVLSATGRKFLRAPRGTGILYVRGEVVDRFDPPGIDGQSAAWVDQSSYELADGAARFEEFEVSFAARLGMGAAIDQALELGLDAIAERVGALAEGLRESLSALPGVRVHDGSGARSAIVTFSVAGREPSLIVAGAAAAGININASSAPWARLDFAARGSASVVRASPHYFNSEDDLAALTDVVATA